MPSDELVSIIIPVFNAEVFLSETLASIESQTHKMWEVIIVNDGSVDNSERLAQDWARRQSQRVELLQNSSTQGPSYSRNRGIKKSTGNLIAFLDADDIWEANRLSAGVAHFARDKNLGLSYGQVVRIINDEGRNAGTIRLGPACTLPKMLWGGPHSTSNVMVSKAALISCARDERFFDETLTHAEDSELWWRIAALTGASIQSIDKLLLNYRVHESNGGDIEKQISGKIQALQRARTYMPAVIENYGALSLAATYRYLCRREISMGAPTKAWGLIKKAIELDNRLLWIGGVKTWSTLLVAALLHFTAGKRNKGC